MKKIVVTSLFWLMLMFCVFWARSEIDRSRWVDFQSDGVLPLSAYMGRIAKEDDPAKRVSMATEMGDAMREARNLRELKFAIGRVCNKYPP